ncbi:hypothetical protein BDN71DRAFT_1588662 [Pleurotus eryngii]|uniref:Amidohydrolase-related domain-containing protein n=1 Tax=Pleurotus eryngii TaxID=5323 RepID=A0A9P5ZYJ6_PLEER|nr:hypothetical protein BDN71DRAFT_1588662 [Pleurotus eryngii]
MLKKCSSHLHYFQPYSIPRPSLLGARTTLASGSSSSKKHGRPLRSVSQSAVGQSADELNANLLDVHNQRLARMDANGVDFVLSRTSPCIQGIADPVEAASLARQVNDELADTISNNTLRLGGFAALAMQNATEAAQEMKRAVQELVFFGAFATLLFYDTPEFDPFWQMVTDLTYRRTSTRGPTFLQSREFSHSRYLLGPSQEFAVTLSTHMASKGSGAIAASQNRTYLLDTWENEFGFLAHRRSRTNLLETSSGNFGTDLLKFHISQIGLDRILYSVDCPFVAIEQGVSFISGLPQTTGLSEEEITALKRGRAIELLELDQ